MSSPAVLPPGRRRGRPGYDLASVLAVAVELFNERGYDGTSMRDLAARLGIAKSAIYHHVTGKEELLSLALDRALDGLAAVTSRARALPAPAIERLEYLVRGSVEVLEAESPYVTLLLRVRGNTDVERAALDKRRAFDRFVAELVAEAVRDGDIRPDADAMITARLLFGLVNSIVEWYRPDRRRRPPRSPTRSARWRSTGCGPGAGSPSVADRDLQAPVVPLRPGRDDDSPTGGDAPGAARDGGRVQRVRHRCPRDRGSVIPARLSSSRRRSRPAAVCLLCASGAPARAQNASSGWTSCTRTISTRSGPSSAG